MSATDQLRRLRMELSTISLRAEMAAKALDELEAGLAGSSSLADQIRELLDGYQPPRQEAAEPEEPAEETAAAKAGAGDAELRTCRKCGEAKPADEFYKSHPTVCKECKRKRQRELNEQLSAADGVQLRKCRTCKKERPLDDFRITYTGKHHTTCRECEASKIMAMKEAEKTKADEPFYEGKRRAAEEMAARAAREALAR